MSLISTVHANVHVHVPNTLTLHTGRFWSRQGYIPVYLRQTPVSEGGREGGREGSGLSVSSPPLQNELTGEHSCIMLRCLTADDQWLHDYHKGQCWGQAEERGRINVGRVVIISLSSPSPPLLLSLPPFLPPSLPPSLSLPLSLPPSLPPSLLDFRSRFLSLLAYQFRSFPPSLALTLTSTKSPSPDSSEPRLSRSLPHPHTLIFPTPNPMQSFTHVQ